MRPHAYYVCAKTELIDVSERNNKNSPVRGSFCFHLGASGGGLVALDDDAGSITFF